MTALTKDFDTRVKVSPRRTRTLPALAATLYYQGGIVCKDANGRATKATAAMGLHAYGVVKDQVDNSSGLADAETIEIETGVHGFTNHGTQTLVQADVGKPCYLYDDNTVGKLSATAGGIAGILEEIGPDRVYVRIGDQEFAGYEEPSVEAKENADATLLYGTTEFTVDGTDTAALPDGNYIGQIKRLVCVAATTSPDLTVTPVSLKNFTTITLDAVGETWVGRWDGSEWETLLAAGATLA